MGALQVHKSYTHASDSLVRFSAPYKYYITLHIELTHQQASAFILQLAEELRYKLTDKIVKNQYKLVR